MTDVQSSPLRSFSGVGVSQTSYSVPPYALAAAYRVCCMRCLRKSQKDGEMSCSFTSPESKLCDYCIVQKGACVPIPDPCKEQFADLQSAKNPDQVRQLAGAVLTVADVYFKEFPSKQKDLDEWKLRSSMEISGRLQLLSDLMKENLSSRADHERKLMDSLTTLNNSVVRLTDALSGVADALLSPTNNRE